MSNDKLTNEEVAPHGWVKVPQSRSLGGTCLRVGDDYYIPAKREPRVFEGMVVGHSAGIPFVELVHGWITGTRVRVTEILEDETP